MRRSEEQDSVRLSFVALTVAVSVGVAVFFTFYSLIPVTRSDNPGVGSAFIAALMTCVIAVQVGTPALVRRFSLRGVLLSSLLVVGAGSVVTGTAPSMVPLLIGGAVTGAGFGVLIVAGSQGVGLLVTGPRLGRALGIYGFVTVTATALGSPTGVQVGITFSPLIFGIAAAVLCVLGALATLGIPSSVGRAPTAEAPSPPPNSSPSSPKSSASGQSTPDPVSRMQHGQATSTVGALQVLALPLTFLLLAVLFLSHGLTSLPVIVESMPAAITILVVQLGCAAGRWLGGFAEPRLTTSGTVVLATALIVLGAVVGVLTISPGVVPVAAAVLGMGVGTAQTVALHTAMRRTDPGRASVVWNLGVDGGLWMGGILAGLVLAQGVIVPAVFIAAALILIAGVVVALRGRRRA